MARMEIPSLETERLVLRGHRPSLENHVRRRADHLICAKLKYRPHGMRLAALLPHGARNSSDARFCPDDDAIWDTGIRKR